jgi:Pyruvate/2-oxoacid:ferredoxin oxidoreductase delta subunit
LHSSTIAPDRAKKLRFLAGLMNTRLKNRFPVTDALLSCFDVALPEEEVDFLIKMGTVEHGTGQYLGKSEAISLLRELQLKGANCCWDCCGVFGSCNRGLPLNLHSYYEARLPDPSRCNGCETCLGYCPVQAVTMANDQCVIDSSQCIGCGQCEIHCSEQAIRLIANERTVFLPLRKKSEVRIQ